MHVFFFVFHFEVSLEYFFPGGQIKVAQNEKQTKKYGKFCMHPFARLFHF